MKKLIALSCLAAGCYTSEENLGFNAVGTPRWAVTFGGPANDTGTSIAVDSIGDVLAGGNLVTRDPLRNDHLIERSFITKRVASDGAERWMHAFSNADARSMSHLTDLAVGPQDMVYVVGIYAGTVDFGGQMLTLPPDKSGAFVAAFSPLGDLAWVRGVGDSAQALSVTVDAQGRVFVLGSFVNSSIQLGAAVFIEAHNDPDVFLAAFDPLGAVLWGTAFQAAAPGTQQGAGPAATGLAIAANGDVLIAGSFTAPVSFGGAVLEPQSRNRGFLARYRNDGLYLSSQMFGRPAPYTTSDVKLAVDATGHIVLQHVEQDDNEQPVGDHLGARPNVLRVLANDGNELWQADVTNHGGYTPQIRTLTATPSGSIVTSAWTDAPYNADDRGSVTGAMEVIAFDASGTPALSTFGNRQWAGLQQTMTFDTAVAATGALAYTGTFAGVVDFGTGIAAGTHGQDDADVFIVSVDPPAAAP